MMSQVLHFSKYTLPWTHAASLNAAGTLRSPFIFLFEKIELYCGKVFRDIYVVLRNSGKYLDTGLKSCIYLDSWRVLGILIIREHSNHIQYWTKIYICKKYSFKTHTSLPNWKGLTEISISLFKTTADAIFVGWMPL